MRCSSTTKWTWRSLLPAMFTQNEKRSRLCNSTMSKQSCRQPDFMPSASKSGKTDTWRKCMMPECDGAAPVGYGKYCLKCRNKQSEVSRKRAKKEAPPVKNEDHDDSSRHETNGDTEQKTKRTRTKAQSLPTPPKQCASPNCSGVAAKNRKKCWSCINKAKRENQETQERPYRKCAAEGCDQDAPSHDKYCWRCHKER